MDPRASTPPSAHLFSFFTSNSHQKHGTLPTPVDFQLPTTTPNPASKSKHLYSLSKSHRHTSDVDSKHSIVAKEGITEPLVVNVRAEDEYEMISASCNEFYRVACEVQGSADHMEALEASAEKDPSVSVDVQPVLSLGSSTKRFKVELDTSVGTPHHEDGTVSRYECAVCRAEVEGGLSALDAHLEFCTMGKNRESPSSAIIVDSFDLHNVQPKHETPLHHAVLADITQRICAATKVAHNQADLGTKRRHDDDKDTGNQNPSTSPVPVRPRGSEDAFSYESVKEWSKWRIKAWERRHTTQASTSSMVPSPPPTILPSCLASPGGARTLGASDPHGTGYQCSGHYRRLITEGILKDEAYAVVEGKLKQVGRERTGGVVAGTDGLSERWKTEQVREMERKVEAWLREVKMKSATSLPFESASTSASTTSVSTTSASTTSASTTSVSTTSASTTSASTTSASASTSSASTSSASTSSASTTSTSAFSPAFSTHPKPKPKPKLKLKPTIATTVMTSLSSSNPPFARTLIAHFRSAADRTPKVNMAADKDDSSLTRSSSIAALARVVERVVEPRDVRDVDERALERAVRGAESATERYQELLRFEKDKPAHSAPSVTVFCHRPRSARKPHPLSAPTNNDVPYSHQADLSRFFAGVPSRRIEVPDDKVSYDRIPKEIGGVVHIISSLPKEVTAGNVYIELDDMRSFSADTLNTAEQQIQRAGEGGPLEFEGVLVDPPWELYIEDVAGEKRRGWSVRMLATLIRLIRPFHPTGLLFLWTHKLLQADVVRAMHALGYRYVENLVWCRRRLNNTPVACAYPYFRSCKEILLIFKRGDNFELRHQRSADVIIDFVKPKEWVAEELTEPKPEAVRIMIETLLPKAGYDPAKGRGKLLELWSKRKNSRRPGWFEVHERKHPDGDCPTGASSTTFETHVVPVESDPDLPPALLHACRGTMLVGAVSVEALEEEEELLVPRRGRLAERFGVDIEELSAEKILIGLKMLKMEKDGKEVRYFRLVVVR
ncbi:hypothetical protein BC937DRAFT_87939 [Endogone sp. FLAS-F59071]|nr:hypothetical protein BC937DRAFT_87939 [Endogone sp. FLAS-F59071]|eukprot:RUS19143.1 hypothetical protein BC937DRAFT_87939 [Endogone sp. FLAS-F59071]